MLILYIVNVEAAIYRNDQWLIIRRSETEEHASGLLSLVGGKVETQVATNLVLEENLRREVMEEVGVVVSDQLQYLESKVFLTDQGELVVDVVFVCKYLSGDAKPMSLDEVSAVFWLTSEEIIANPAAPIWLKETIAKAEKVRE